MYSLPSLAILLVLSFLLAKGAVKMVEKERESSKLSGNLEAKAAALVLREQALNSSIAHLQTEEGIKDEIKKKFSVTQEGEYVAVIIDDSAAASSTDPSLLPWYKKLWVAIMTRISSNMTE